MDPLWISIAFVFGLGAKLLRLPPLVGYLIAGFILGGTGAKPGPALDTIANLGVTLLLFTIGLKLKPKSLMAPNVWAGATIHTLLVTVSFAVIFFIFGQAQIPFFSSLTFPICLLMGFSLSFSSTVFAVKVFEDKGGLNSLQGQSSIGILIMQDIFAVIFIAFSAGKIPSPWAPLLVVGIFLLRPVFFQLMSKSGHGELFVLLGLFLALVVGYSGFEWVTIKGDLGALLLGFLMSGHKKSNELAKSLLNFKDLFLVGFFLQIGLLGVPNWSHAAVAGVFTLLLVLKVVLYFGILTRFKLRSRTSFITSLSLANYSEFGLLVAAIAYANKWLSADFVVIIGLVDAITFILASPLNSHAESLYMKCEKFLRPFEKKDRHPHDLPIDPGNAEMLIFGMGRIGTGVYDTAIKRFGSRVLGLDSNPETVEKQKESKRNVIMGDATDSDFWHNIKPGKIHMVVLAMHHHSSNLFAVKHLRSIGYKGLITSIAQYPDQTRELKDAGIDAAYNFYQEAGQGFANHIMETCQDRF